MGFEEILNTDDVQEEKAVVKEKITPNQVYDVITSKKPDWQAIIYDLINSEQLDPWDVDLILLTNKYFEKIFELEQDPDFYVSSKVLLAAALLLRLKSEFLLNKYIRSIDEILFGKKEEKTYVAEKIQIDENELPLLIPKTPLPRLKKITLKELIDALNHEINTETRRIKREIQVKYAVLLLQIDISKFRRIDIKDRIKELHNRILSIMQASKSITYSQLTNNDKEHKLATFLPLLHLSNTRKLWLEQKNHLDDIMIYLYKHFEDNREHFMEDLEEDVEEMKKELELLKQSENIDEKKSGLEKAREKIIQRKKFEQDIRNELKDELKINLPEENAESLSKEALEIEALAKEALALEEAENSDKEKIDEVTGFSNTEM